MSLDHLKNIISNIFSHCIQKGKVHSASIVLNIPDLEKIAAKRKRAVRRLEKRYDDVTISLCVGLLCPYSLFLSYSIAYYEAKGKRGTHVVGRKRFRCFGVETFPIFGFGG